MTLSPQGKRLTLLGTALALTLASAGWLFFGKEESESLAAPAATPARATRAAATRDSAPRDSAPRDSAAPTTAAASAPNAAAPAAAPMTPARRRLARAVAEARDTTPRFVTIERETFAYAAEGRRDPFRPLISTSVLRPLPSELRLVAVAYDPAGVSSVAILRDLTTKQQHRVRVGQLLGRMRVARIRQKDVVFTIEELGFSRQEILGLQDSTATRLP